ncbi:MAG: hypothetical protein K8I02_04840, partial [Candidatus Methylomirabilis sp.]|nr:hypothetical protein [Deltaproteobacteria bacterium]
MFGKIPNTDAARIACRNKVGAAPAKGIADSEIKNLSVQWGVTLGTRGYRHKRSLGPYTKRTAEISFPDAGLNGEKTVLGAEDLVHLAHDVWGLKGLTFACPIEVWEKGRLFPSMRFGPSFWTKAMVNAEAAADNCLDMVQSFRPDLFDRLYVGVGTEVGPSTIDPDETIALVKAIRSRIDAAGVENADVLVYSMSGVRWGKLDALVYAKKLYDALASVPGVYADPHLYSSTESFETDAGGFATMSPVNVAKLLALSASTRGFWTIGPRQWGAAGPDMASVSMEWALEGPHGDPQVETKRVVPFPVLLATADLQRERFASDAVSCLKWMLRGDSPEEWNYTLPDDRFQANEMALRLAFLARSEVGFPLPVTTASACPRANATLKDGAVRVYGINACPAGAPLGVTILGAARDPRPLPGLPGGRPDRFSGGRAPIPPLRPASASQRPSGGPSIPLRDPQRPVHRARRPLFLDEPR